MFSTFLVKFGFDTAENEPCNLPRTTALRRAPRGGARPAGRGPRRGGMAAVLGAATFIQGSFSAVSKRNFASKYAFESSRRALYNPLLWTALKSDFFLKNC